jgi:hypothetical protein
VAALAVGILQIRLQSSGILTLCGWVEEGYIVLTSQKLQVTLK